MEQPSYKECYKNGLRKWFSFIIKEPHILLKGSLLAWLCHLPLITFGPAKLATSLYMGKNVDGYVIKWREAAAFGFGSGKDSPKSKAWIMGLCDVFAVLLAIGSGYAILEMDLSLPLKILYGFVLFLDFLYLASAMYRYPALAREPDNKLALLIARGILITVGSFGWSIMFLCTHLLWLLACTATGVGLFLLYPAGATALSYSAYTEMIKHFISADGSVGGPEDENVE